MSLPLSYTEMIHESAIFVVFSVFHGTIYMSNLLGEFMAWS